MSYLAVIGSSETCVTKAALVDNKQINHTMLQGGGDCSCNFVSVLEISYMTTFCPL